MRDSRINRFAYRLGRAVGFAIIPMKLFIVAYGAWIAADMVWRP